MKSHRIGERIVVSCSGDRWMATISGAIPDWRRQGLELWLGAWGALGAMLAYGAWSFPGGERQFYLICMGFWAFFAMRGWKAAIISARLCCRSPDSKTLQINVGGGLLPIEVGQSMML